MDLVRTFLASTLLAVFATGQSTLIVDGAMGPGAQFVDLPDAVAAAVRGDTILLRPTAVYSSVVIDQALEIRSSDPLQRARIGPLVIENLAPFDGVILSDVIVESGVGDGLVVRRCDSVVRIENVEVVAVGAPEPSARFEQSLRVDVSDLLGLRSLVVESTYLSADGLRILSDGTGPALSLTDCVALVRNSILTGFSATVLDCSAAGIPTPTAACGLQGAELRIDDSSLFRGGALSQFLPPSVCVTEPGIGGVGAVIFDGAGTAPVTGPSILALNLDQFELESPPTALPGAITVELEIGALPNAALFAGVLMDRPFQLNFQFELWLNPTLIIPLSIEMPNAQGLCTWSVPIPPTLALGAPLAFQAVIDPFGIFVLSEPAVTIRR